MAKVWSTAGLLRKTSRPKPLPATTILALGTAARKAATSGVVCMAVPRADSCCRIRNWVMEASGSDCLLSKAASVRKARCLAVCFRDKRIL